MARWLCTAVLSTAACRSAPERDEPATPARSQDGGSVPQEAKKCATFLEVRVETFGATQIEVELAVLRPLEAAMQTVPGLRATFGRAEQGRATLWLEVDEVAPALAPIRAALDQPGVLPEQTRTSRIVDVTAAAEVAVVVATSSTGDLAPHVVLEMAMRAEADPDVAAVDRHGALDLEVVVDADPDRLRQYGLTPDDLAQAIDDVRTADRVGLDSLRHVELRPDPHAPPVPLDAVASIRLDRRRHEAFGYRGAPAYAVSLWSNDAAAAATRLVDTLRQQVPDVTLTTLGPLRRSGCLQPGRMARWQGGPSWIGVWLPPGTTSEARDAFVARAITLAGDSEALVGSGAAVLPVPVGDPDLQVLAAPDTAEAIHQALARIPGAVVRTAAGPNVWPISIGLTHFDDTVLRTALRRLADAALTHDVVALPPVAERPRLELRERAGATAATGIDPGVIAEALRARQSQALGLWTDGAETYPLTLRLGDEADLELDLDAVMLRTASGGRVPLSEVAEIHRELEPTVVNRRDGRVEATVVLLVAPPRRAEVQALLRDELLPALRAEIPGLRTTELD